jgi:hypothetical protein
MAPAKSAACAGSGCGEQEVYAYKTATNYKPIQSVESVNGSMRWHNGNLKLESAH